MEKYIWIFPILFIFHDLEEIIGFGIWGKKNIPIMEKKIPKLVPMYKKLFMLYSTEGMALAVFEILVLCIVICLLATYFGLYQIWIGAFIAFILHLFMHIVQAIIWHGYIPAVITSIIAAPISVIIVLDSIKILNYSAYTIILWTIVGLVIIFANVKFAHFLMHWFTRKMSAWI